MPANQQITKGNTMKLEQMDILDAIEDNLPAKQIIELERQARLYRIELQKKIDLTRKRWELHYDLVSTYMNFPFLY